MSNFIHKFSTAAEREAATYTEPWVSYTTETDDVEYSKIQIDIESLTDYEANTYTQDITPTRVIPYTDLKGIHIDATINYAIVS